MMEFVHFFMLIAGVVLGVTLFIIGIAVYIYYRRKLASKNWERLEKPAKPYYYIQGNLNVLLPPMPVHTDNHLSYEGYESC